MIGILADKEWCIQYAKNSQLYAGRLMEYAIFIEFFRKWRTINKIFYENGVQYVYKTDTAESGTEFVFIWRERGR